MSTSARNVWRIGAVTGVTVVEQKMTVMPVRLFPKASEEGVRAIPWQWSHHADGDGHLHMNIQNLVVRTASCVVVDTCVGNDRESLHHPAWNGMKTSFLKDFAATRVAREDVDVVLCTHLHADHVGWNTLQEDGAWQPTFPKARCLIDRAEYEYWRAHADEEQAAALMRRSPDPIGAADLLQLIDGMGGYEVCEEIKLTPTPGYPGSYKRSHHLGGRERPDHRGRPAPSLPDGPAGMGLRRRWRQRPGRTYAARAPGRLRGARNVVDRHPLRWRPHRPRPPGRRSMAAGAEAARA